MAKSVTSLLNEDCCEEVCLVTFSLLQNVAKLGQFRSEEDCVLTFKQKPQ